MDPLSLSCNVMGVLTVASKLLMAGYSYRDAVKDFPSDLQELVEELSSLNGILHALSAVVEPFGDGNVAAGNASARPNPSTIAKAMITPLEDCRNMLIGMVVDLEKYQKSGSTVQKVVKRLSWPLKESETKAWIEKIRRCKSTFALGLSADELILTRAVYEELGEIKQLQVLESQRKYMTEKKKKLSKMLRWISPADAEANHSAACKLQQSGTGKWFTEGQTFKNWFTQENSFLWLHGIPGTGKTILSSIIIDRIMSEVNTGGTDTAITYFYFDFKESIKQTSFGFLGSIVAQLIRKKVETIDRLEPLYADSGQGKLLPNLRTLEGTLHEIAREFFKVIIVIDALDECAEHTDFFQVVERLRGLKNLSLLITSRDDLGIRLQFANLSSLSIKKDDVSIDIENFVVGEIQRQPKLARLKSTTKSEITTNLVKGSRGLFRWAKCCLDQIAKLRSDKAIKTALKSLPPTLDETYERILCAISEEDRDLAIRVLRWLLFSCRPMTLMEVVDGIAVEIGHESMDQDTKLNEPGDILDICGGLIDLDEENHTLGLAHFTVKEYLISNNIMQGPAVGYHVQRTIAHAELAKICLTYIMFDDFDNGPCDDYETRLEEFPLLAYAVSYWPEHVSEYENDGDEILDQLVLSFFHLGPDSEKFQAWRQLYEIRSLSRGRPVTASEINRSLENIKWPPATPLYFAASIGHLQAVEELLEFGADVNVEGGEFGTPVVATVMGGHVETLRLLLEKGADPNQNNCDTTKRNLLYIASEAGHAECVQTLLDFNANPEAPSTDNLLVVAGWAGHGNVFEVLVEADFFKKKEPHGDPSDQALSSDTVVFVEAFHFAGWQGFEKPFRILFQKGREFLLTPSATPERDILQHTIRQAIIHGHLKIVKAVLQDKDAKALCIRDDTFRTLLQEASYAGRENIVNLLLSLKKTPGPGATGFSLHLAAASGNINIIERLIKAGANPNELDDDGWSPILCASEYHNLSAVEKLSKVVDDLGVISRVGPNHWDISHQPGVSTDGLEIIGGRGRAAVFRALYPITSSSINYSFEIEIVDIGASRVVIGFADGFFRHSVDGRNIFETEPGMCGRSWGYSIIGNITLNDEMDGQIVQPHKTGDLVGCHFDKIKEVAFFTVNGQIVGKPIADMEGKIFPMIQVGEGDHIRTNFGVCEVPTLTTKDMRNLWRPTPAIHIKPQLCEPNC